MNMYTINMCICMYAIICIYTIIYIRVRADYTAENKCFLGFIATRHSPSATPKG